MLANVVGVPLGAFAGQAIGWRGPFWALALFSHSATVILVFLLGLFGMSTNPILIGKAVGYADEAPTLASALATSAFNVGTAVGSWIAGFALESSLGATGPVVVGAAIAALYFLPLSVHVLKDRRAEKPRVEVDRPEGKPVVVDG